MNSDGKTITTWGNIGIGNGKFLEPKDLVLDNLGYLYVLDSAQGLIQKFETPVVAQIEEALTAEQFRKLQELSYAEATAQQKLKQQLKQRRQQKQQQYLILLNQLYLHHRTW